jgi:hypothetical protein
LLQYRKCKQCSEKKNLIIYKYKNEMLKATAIYGRGAKTEPKTAKGTGASAPFAVFKEGCYE